MKTLAFTLASLLCGTALVHADPDFTSKPPPRPADPSLAASDGTREIEPETQIAFAFDSKTLDGIAASQLRQVARWMKAHPRHNLVVEGHTDRAGTHEYNIDLAKRRADEVRERLIQSGIPGDRLVIAVYGDREARPVADAGDRRAILFASRRPTDELAASLLSSTKADEVVWTSRGAQVHEQLSLR
jgi:outer membrane protein OmpA-like peptidoglycan-associated protein